MNTSLRRTTLSRNIAFVIDEEEELKGNAQKDESSQSKNPFCQDEVKDGVAQTRVGSLVSASESIMAKLKSYSTEKKQKIGSIVSPNTSLKFKSNSSYKIVMKKTQNVPSTTRKSVPKSSPRKDKSRNNRILNSSKTQPKSRSFLTSRKPPLTPITSHSKTAIPSQPPPKAQSRPKTKPIPTPYTVSETSTKIGTQVVYTSHDGSRSVTNDFLHFIQNCVKEKGHEEKL